uniref:Carboxylesterase type B domain-containing protein n=1 Tax=Panagrolaimus davidi TaxID=227884 RepID=A0A914PGD4_9BILA
MLVNPKFNSTTKETIIDRIFDFYQVGVGANATDPNHYFYKYTEIFSIIVKTAIGTEIEAKSDLGWEDQYMYVFNYVRPQDRNLIGNSPGHGYELLYLCGLNIYTTNGNSNTTEDNLVQSNLAQIFVSFIKGQNPSTNGLSIPKITANSIPYALVSTDVTIGTTNIKPVVDFWKQLAADYQFDFLQQINL